MIKKGQTQSIIFGLHLMIDIYNVDQKILDDSLLLYNFLEYTPTLLHMKMISKPYLVRVKGNNIKDPGGWSGFVIIEESHISVHTFTKRGFASIDVYSCKEFQPQPVIKYITKLFKTANIETYLQKRGIKYPAKNIY